MTKRSAQRDRISGTRRTFYVTDGASDEKKELKQLHVNFWIINRRSHVIDVGLLLDIPVEQFLAHGINVSLYTPFEIDHGEVEDLYEVLKHPQNLELLFNDHVKNTTFLGRPGSDSATAFQFQSNRSVLLVPVTIHKREECDAVVLSVSPDTFRNDEFFEKVEKVAVYFRIRFRVVWRNGKVLHEEISGLSRRLQFDFRFYDIRSLSSDDSNIIPRVLPATRIYLFVVLPSSYDISLGNGAGLRNTRLLEPGNAWVPYLTDLEKEKRSLLVYYWRREIESPTDPTFNLVTGFTSERSGVVKRLQLASIVTLISVSLLLTSQFVDFSDFAHDAGPHLRAILQWVGSAGIVIVLGIISTALWDGVKTVADFLWSRERA
jgi:hypothetical protein